MFARIGMMRALIRGFAFVEGVGCGRATEWPAEPSIFAFGISRAEASAIGRRYRQNLSDWVGEPN
jgi:hypothetical protein